MMFYVKNFVQHSWIFLFWFIWCKACEHSFEYHMLKSGMAQWVLRPASLPPPICLVLIAFFSNYISGVHRQIFNFTNKHPLWMYFKSHYVLMLKFVKLWHLSPYPFFSFCLKVTNHWEGRKLKSIQDSYHLNLWQIMLKLRVWQLKLEHGQYCAV